MVDLEDAVDGIGPVFFGKCVESFDGMGEVLVDQEAESAGDTEPGYFLFFVVDPSEEVEWCGGAAVVVAFHGG